MEELEKGPKLMLYCLGLIQELIDAGLGGDCPDLLTHEGKAKASELFDSGFRPPHGEVEECLKYLISVQKAGITIQ